MGMFDFVDLRIKCPECGKETGGFQTKDTECTLSSVPYGQLTNFYGSCDHCDVWIEFYLKEIVVNELSAFDCYIGSPYGKESPKLVTKTIEIVK